MKIIKSGETFTAGTPDAAELEQINRFARARLEAEQVYTFALVLCDNDIDRDLERFEDATLRDLAELFVGRTGISDHQWKSGNQVARIYRCQFETQPGRKTADGRDYACVKAWAYMLRTNENEALIADIEGGIKRETSVGCSVAESVCSICGKAYGSVDCGHEKGQEYGGKLCHVLLRGAVDAYEWSFVAVPAQKNAGVTKALAGFEQDQGPMEQLEKMAALGKEYLETLRGEVMRLGLICDRGLYKAMGPALERLEAGQLKEMKAALEEKCAEKLPISTQLPGMGEVTRFDGSDFII